MYLTSLAFTGLILVTDIKLAVLYNSAVLLSRGTDLGHGNITWTEASCVHHKSCFHRTDLGLIMESWTGCIGRIGRV